MRILVFLSCLLCSSAFCQQSWWNAVAARQAPAAAGGGGCTTVALSRTGASTGGAALWKFSEYFAFPVTNSGSAFTCCSVVWSNQSTTLTPTGNYDVSIYNDSSGNPGTAQASSASVAKSTIIVGLNTNSLTSTVSITGGGAVFWIVLHSATTDSSNFPNIGNIHFSGGRLVVSSNGTSWSGSGDSSEQYYLLLQ